MDLVHLLQQSDLFLLRKELYEWYQGIPPFFPTVVQRHLDYFSMWHMYSCLLVWFLINMVGLKTFWFPPLWWSILMYNAIFCSVGGSFLTYIYPRRFVIPYLNHLIIREPISCVVDVIAHHVPLYWCCTNIYTFVHYPYSIFLSKLGAFLFIIYMGGISPILRLYGVSWKEMMVVLFITECLFYISTWNR